MTCASNVQSALVFLVLNPLHPNISIHILHTNLFTIAEVLTKRICDKIKASKIGDHFYHSRHLYA